MPANVEIKARARDFARQQALAERLAGGESELLRQRDTFFKVARGRLKLRELGNGRAELIQYQRPDLAGVKTSEYLVVPVADPGLMKAALGGALGIRAEVKKQRWLYLVGQTRIHFDEVEGLGEFIELEVVMNSTQSVSEGEEVAQGLMDRLEIAREDLVAQAYVDLLELRCPPC